MKRNFTKPNKSTKYWKISLVFFGIFLCLVLLEIGLRIGGIVLLSMQERRNMAGFQAKDAYRIMCLGESTTYDGIRIYPSIVYVGACRYILQAVFYHHGIINSTFRYYSTYSNPSALRHDFEK